MSQIDLPNGIQNPLSRYPIYGQRDGSMIDTAIAPRVRPGGGLDYSTQRLAPGQRIPTIPMGPRFSVSMPRYAGPDAPGVHDSQLNPLQQANFRSSVARNNADPYVHPSMRSSVAAYPAPLISSGASPGTAPAAPYLSPGQRLAQKRFDFQQQRYKDQQENRKESQAQKDQRTRAKLAYDIAQSELKDVTSDHLAATADIAAATKRRDDARQAYLNTFPEPEGAFQSALQDFAGKIGGFLGGAAAAPQMPPGTPDAPSYAPYAAPGVQAAPAPLPGSAAFTPEQHAQINAEAAAAHPNPMDLGRESQSIRMSEPDLYSMWQASRDRFGHDRNAAVQDFTQKAQQYGIDAQHYLDKWTQSGLIDRPTYSAPGLQEGAFMPINQVPPAQLSDLMNHPGRYGAALAHNPGGAPGVRTFNQTPGGEQFILPGGETPVHQTPFQAPYLPGRGPGATPAAGMAPPVGVSANAPISRAAQMMLPAAQTEPPKPLPMSVARWIRTRAPNADAARAMAQQMGFDFNNVVADQ